MVAIGDDNISKTPGAYNAQCTIISMGIADSSQLKLCECFRKIDTPSCDTSNALSGTSVNNKRRGGNCTAPE